MDNQNNKQSTNTNNSFIKENDSKVAANRPATYFDGSNFKNNDSLKANGTNVSPKTYIRNPYFYEKESNIELDEEEVEKEIKEDNNETVENIQKQPINLPKEEKVVNGKGKVDNLLKAQKIIKFIFKYKWLILIGGIFLIFLFIILLFFYSDNVNTSDNRFGLNGYTYFEVEDLCTTVTVYEPETNTYTRSLDFETEYIPGVVNAEVGGFSDSFEAMKLYAIAARTYALTHLSKECIIEGSTRVQAFTYDENVLASVTQADNPIMQAVQATYGLILVKDGHIAPSYYDAGCYRKEDDDYYYFGIGSQTIGEEQLQPIPKDWVEQYDLYDYVQKSKENNTECYQGHGMGFSQYGAYYLATQEGYTLLDLIDYYYRNVEINSLYPGISDNYIIATSDGANDQLTKSLRDFFAENGITPEAYNEYILKSVIEAGIGTRKAVVAAATSLVGGLYQNYGVRLPYTLSGQHYGEIPNYEGKNLNHSGDSFYGVDPEWGSLIQNSSDNLFHYYYEGSDHTYTRYGPDCSGFVTWVLHNAGFANLNPNQDSYGPHYKMEGTRAGDPGDLMANSGHIMVIVGVDDNHKLYYVAHASSGNSGTKISTISFTNDNYYIIDMDEWYENNKPTISTEDFITNFRNGYIDPYTGEYDLNFDLSITENSTYFVGDSRTVGVCNAAYICTSDESCDTRDCLALVGSGYSWFKQNLSKINAATAHKIIINMGINDLVGVNDGKTKAEEYYKQFEILARSNPNKIFYIESINPVGSGTVKKEAVESFNKQMQILIKDSNYNNLLYLNTYSALNYQLEDDGIHYKYSTYKELYDYIRGVI